jgi:hypothetical protein
MTLDDLKDSLDNNSPPEKLSDELRALWLAARDGWEAGHVIVQKLDTPTAAWVHAHLHRIEGDNSNAAYWYRHADQAPCNLPLDAEWDQIATALLDA